MSYGIFWIEKGRRDLDAKESPNLDKTCFADDDREVGEVGVVAKVSGEFGEVQLLHLDASYYTLDRRALCNAVAEGLCRREVEHRLPSGISVSVRVLSYR